MLDSATEPLRTCMSAPAETPIMRCGQHPLSVMMRLGLATNVDFPLYPDIVAFSVGSVRD